MKIQYHELLRTLPTGTLVCDHHLRVHYMNDYARRLMPWQATGEFLAQPRFMTTDRQLFDMGECMRGMVASGKRIFHKTLILAHGQAETLVFFTANGFRNEGKDLFILVMADISDEMDCVAPGRFIRKGFALDRHLIGRESSLGEVYRMIRLAAESQVNVMVSGESGTGKELVADAIHTLSERSDGPLIKVNCSSLSESLLESELFGHVRGAFTGAYRDKPGKIEQAHGGTLFLDEIGEISPALQVKLLRVLQEKTIERVGDNRPIPVDMRIIAATNQNLQALIKEGRFREDFYYRLNVFPIALPALRERRLDIPLLSDHFIRRFNESTGKQVKGLGRNALSMLMHYPWPGNIRELQNAIEHAFVLVRGPVIEAGDLPPTVREHPQDGSGNQAMDTLAGAPYPSDKLQRKGRRLQITKTQMEEALAANDWNQTRTAKTLGISRVSLWRKMKKLGL